MLCLIWLGNKVVDAVIQPGGPGLQGTDKPRVSQGSDPGDLIFKDCMGHSIVEAGQPGTYVENLLYTTAKYPHFLDQSLLEDGIEECWCHSIRSVATEMGLGTSVEGQNRRLTPSSIDRAIVVRYRRLFQ